MKLFHKVLLNGTAAAVLFFVGTGLAHADKGGSKGGASGGTAKAVPSNASSGMKAGQRQQAQAKKVGSGQINNNMAKSNSQHQMQHQQNIKKDFCSTPWNYCNSGYGYGSCWNYPTYRSSCSYPVYDYCYTTPVCYPCQPQVIASTRVIQVIQPAPVVETGITTSSTGACVRPPLSGAGYQHVPLPRK